MFHHLGPGAHAYVAVCQPSVPVLAAVSLMSEERDPDVPATMTLMGGPIDTRLRADRRQQDGQAEGHRVVPAQRHHDGAVPHPGFMRAVYPGFLQLGGFMSMNLDRHMSAYHNLFRHLVDGDGDSAEKHREFYDEYLAVMDLTAEFYLQTVETVFVRHALPNGQMMHRDRPVRTEAIRRTALLTVEGERDDISGVGQTKAAHALCTNIPHEKKSHYLQKEVGHYGVFNGSRWRTQIQPRIHDFIRKHGAPGSTRLNGATEPLSIAGELTDRMADAMGLTALHGKNLPALSQSIGNELTQIIGIGPKMAERLNAVGIFDIHQLADMADDGRRGLDAELRGRARREDWFGQARRMMGLEERSGRARREPRSS